MITSRHNKIVTELRAIRSGKLRSLIMAEGIRLCEELLKSQIPIEKVLFTDDLVRGLRGRLLVEEFSRHCNLVLVTEAVLEAIKDTKTPQGIVAIARRPSCELKSFTEKISPNPLLLIMHGINNPSNAGAMLRVAEAAGASGVITAENTVDVFSPKALRGSMGSAFRLPFWSGVSLETILSWCSKHGIQTVGADPRATFIYTNVDWRRSCAIVMSSEASGLTQEGLAMIHETVKIRMRPPVESLNVAVALGIILYEAARQRE